SIVTFLVERIPCAREDLEVCQCAHDVRFALEKDYFDILILDLLLPLREEPEPALKNSLELRAEIATTAAYHRPRHMLGLTAFESAAQEASDAFSKYLWTIIHFSPNDDSWQGPIEQCIRYLAKIKNENGNPKFATDLCIVSALRTPEMDAIHRIEWNWR